VLLPFGGGRGWDAAAEGCMHPIRYSRASANGHDLPVDDFAEAVIARSAGIFGGVARPGPFADLVGRTLTGHASRVTRPRPRRLR
jgi:hypothetical protein